MGKYSKRFVTANKGRREVYVIKNEAQNPPHFLLNNYIPSSSYSLS